MKSFLLSALVLTLGSIGCKQTSVTETPNDKVKSVETHLTTPVYIEGDSTWTIEARMAHYGVPGVSIAVIKDNKIEWVKSYGVMDKDSKESVTTHTLFQAGSISKPVAAYGALHLVEQNKISLDSNINNYLKSWKLPDNEFTKSKKVTLKHLLSHTGGTTVHGFLGYSPELPVPTVLQVLDGTPPANSPEVRVDKIPGESYRYSGGGITIEQLAMTEIENKPFPQIMHDIVLSPLGMNYSTYDQPLKDSMLRIAATGYLPDGSMTKGKRHTYLEMAAAGLWTTAEDLAKFAIDVMNTYQGKSKLVLSQSMAKTMLIPYISDFVGLGLFIDTKKDEIYFGHGGWDEGFSSQMTAHRDKGYGVVILTNSNHPEFIEELIRSVALTYDWAEYMPTYKKVTESQDRMKEIIGRYRRGHDAMFTISYSGGKLLKKPLMIDPVELIKITDSTYVSRNDGRFIQFKLKPNASHPDLLIFNNGTIQSTFIRMKEDEKLPLEYLEAGQFDSALHLYQAFLKDDPKDPTIDEGNINQQGYQLLNKDKIKLAKDLFKINMILYPKSANVYDSYAEACMKNKETDLAIENYKKSLTLNPKNENAIKNLKELEKK